MPPHLKAGPGAQGSRHSGIHQSFSSPLLRPNHGPGWELGPDLFFHLGLRISPFGQAGKITESLQVSSRRDYCAVFSHSVTSDSLPPHGLQPTRLLCQQGFSRQEYCSGLPCPPPGDLPNPGIEPRPPTLQADSLPLDSRPLLNLFRSSLEQPGFVSLPHHPVLLLSQ